MVLEGWNFFSGYDDDDPVTPPANLSINKCNYFVNDANKTVIFEFATPYGGIPNNLAFNTLGWVVLVIIFAILRRMAGNYGRLALVRKEDPEANWTQLFFEANNSNPATDLRQSRLRNPEESISSRDYITEIPDQSRLAWILSIFKLTDDQFRQKCGNDAVQYLRFQRHLMAFLSVVTLVCIVVILPVNFHGEEEGTELEFGHTTISNLHGSDNWLWVHVVFEILFFPIGILFMRHFSVGLKITIQERDNRGTDNSVESRTLMLLSIPTDACQTGYLNQHFAEAYPDDEVLDISVSYDVSKLTKIDLEREGARKARIVCENFQAQHGSSQQMKPHTCGIICMMCSKWCGTCCCPCFKSVDSLTFYREKEERLAQEELNEKKLVMDKCNGIAFITFKRLESAEKVFFDHRWRWCGLLSSKAPDSTVSCLLEPWKWVVQYAPPPKDIYWENITAGHGYYVAKFVVVNILMFLLLFFFTSPALIITQFGIIKHLTHISDALQLPKSVNDFFPTLLLWSLSALLPTIVAYSDWLLGHWRRSVENLWIMRKVFIYLLLMVLIMPSVGLTSLRGILEAFISSTKRPDKKSSYNFEWNCIFLPDNGAFFVNYVVTAALMGTALELLRFSDLFMYAFRMSLARSSAETRSVQKATLYEYPYGFNYGWMLLIFALTTTNSVICPLITPFGLIYLAMKHLVDRYNIYYAYKPSNIDKSIHASAVNFVIFSLLLQQIGLLCFNLVRGPGYLHDGSILNSRVITSSFFIVFYTLIFIGSFFWHQFKGISPIQYYVEPEIDNGNTDHQNEAARHRDEEIGNADPEIGTTDSESEIGAPLNVNRYVPDVLRKDFMALLRSTSSRHALTTHEDVRPLPSQEL